MLIFYININIDENRWSNDKLKVIVWAMLTMLTILTILTMLTMLIHWGIVSRIVSGVPSRYTIRDQILDDGMVSELGISHTYRQDTGIYVCQASNAFGQVSFYWLMYIIYLNNDTQPTIKSHLSIAFNLIEDTSKKHHGEEKTNVYEKISAPAPSQELLFCLFS